MGKTHPPGGLMHDLEKQERLGVLFEKVYFLIFPYVEKAVRPIVEQEATWLQPLMPEDRKALKELALDAATNCGLSTGEAEKVATMIDSADKPLRQSAEQVEKEVQEAAHTIFSGLIGEWAGAFADRIDQIDPKTLDESMLPPGAVFTRGWAQNWSDKFDNQFGLEILRQVRRDLPEGKHLPDEAWEWLKLLWKK